MPPSRRCRTICAGCSKDTRFWRDPTASAIACGNSLAVTAAGVAAAAALLALVAGGVVRERTLRARAEAEADKARTVEEYLVSVFDVANPFAPPQQNGDVTATGAARSRRRAGGFVAVVATGGPGATPWRAGQRLREPWRAGARRTAAALRPSRSSVPCMATVTPMWQPPWIGWVTCCVRQSHFDEAEPLLREALAQRRALVGDRACRYGREHRPPGHAVAGTRAVRRRRSAVPRSRRRAADDLRTGSRGSRGKPQQPGCAALPQGARPAGGVALSRGARHLQAPVRRRSSEDGGRRRRTWPRCSRSRDGSKSLKRSIVARWPPSARRWATPIRA